MKKRKRTPTLKLLIGCFILFGAPAAELFPDFMAGAEADVMGRIWEFYEKIQGDPSTRTKKQIELLEQAIDHAKKRNTNSHL